MAPFGPVPAIVGNETSFSAPVSRRKVSSASTVSISVSAPFGASRSIQARKRANATASRRCAARARDLGFVLHGFQQRDGIAAAQRLAAGCRDQAAQRVGGGGAVERDDA